MVIIASSVFWQASKSRSYRALISQTLGTLVRFLQRNQLVTRELLREGEAVGADFVMRRSDLTDEGFEFYRRIEQPWFAAIDRGSAPADASMLEDALRRIRGRSIRHLGGPPT